MAGEAPAEPGQGTPSPGDVRELAGNRVLVCASEGGALAAEADAGEFLGQALSASVDWMAIPLTRLGPDFLRLGTRVAGGVIQKFVNYRIGFAVFGDLSAALAASEALRDFVREANRGSTTWFVADLREFESRLAERAAGATPVSTQRRFP
jgi:hypothetical protein